ncbi:Helicase associated domain protein [Streptomyces sp. ISL-99]|uniref:DEAD/DEAH box helicase n=1 Tax=Streptomyces sp. ISL-99 TaxID=2819193 RepID=UPI001BEA025F|nr:DEAD/DEAH box helicase [Streptomyces sp. ISL-99]MBT2529934.1 Helicase associated domain protein [Streptomyces sp. ISL-99]
MTHPGIQLRDHQREAFKAAVRSLAHMPRVTVVSATGSGKTITAMRIAEHFASRGNILVVVPSLNLVSQTAGHWARYSVIENMLGVCSLSPAQTGTVRLPLTTNARRIAELVAGNTGPTVVFTTYSSLPALTRAHKKYRLPPWAIAIIDEAHRSSGSSNKQWAAIHKDSAVPARRRLYMTATPRTWGLEDPGKKKRRRKPSAPDGPPEPLASMDDPTIYGPVVYQLGLADAIDRGILADYRIVVPVIDDDELREVLQTRGATQHIDGLRLSALQVSLLRTMATHQVRRVISFHSRIANAHQFSQTLHDTVAAAAKSIGIRRLWAYPLHSGQPLRERAGRLAEFESIPLLRRRTRNPDAVDGAVLSNVRVLGEGVDVPDADAVLFADPKRSPSDIIQALGRALRQPPGSGKIAVLIIPVYVGRRQTTEQALESSEFKILWEVLNGLREHDAKVWRRLGGGGHDPDRDDKAPFPLAPERAAEIAPITSLRAHQTDTRIWSAGWTAAIRFYERRKHLNVPSEYTDPSGYPLGLWIGQQRSLYANGSLAPDRALALSSLNISWPHPPGSFEDRLEAAVTFADTHGTLALTIVPSSSDGPMIRWLNRQRALADSGRMHSARTAALNAVDPWWNPPWGVAWQHDYTHVCLQLATQTNTAAFEPAPVSGEDPHTWLDRQITQLRDLHTQQVRLLNDLAARHPDIHPHSLLLLPASAPRTRAFHRGLKAARQFHQREGHVQVTIGHRENLHGDDVLLGRWIRKCRTNTAQLTGPQISALTALGIEPEPIFQEAELTVPDATEDEDDVWWAAPELPWVSPARLSSH